jgi:phenylalanyl-tRNA synthetase alpha chain
MSRRSDNPPSHSPEIEEISEKISALLEEFEARLQAAGSEAEVQDLQVSLIGKKGGLTALLKGMGGLPAQLRPQAGKLVNDAKQKVVEAIGMRREVIGKESLQSRLAADRLDVTLPPFGSRPGRLHPLTRVLDEIVHIFTCLGFDIADGPEIETDWYNFEALGIPPDHPARQEQATLFVAGRSDLVLRTHTSPVQIRRFLGAPPPVKVISPGFVYRHDDDPTHSPMFLQVEGLMVDERTTFADLKGTLELFLREFFGPETRMRFRASYFQFTEPSGEVDVACVGCGGRGDAGCRMCKGSGWLEILGCGQVDPVVLENVDYDPERMQGFAFGAGIERMAMLKYGIDSIQLFYRNDLRFLRQF